MSNCPYTVEHIDGTATVGWSDGMEDSGGDEAVAAQWARDAIEDWLGERNVAEPTLADWRDYLFGLWLIRHGHAAP